MLDLVGMNEDGRQYQGESAIDNLVKRFERMVEDNDQHYFDLEEFEAIIGHYLGFGEIQNAKKVLQYASSLFPENLMLQLREAQILASIGKHIQAIPRLKTLLAFEPNNEEIHLTLANIYGQIKEHRYAIKHFWKALNNSDEELKSELYIDIALEHQNLGEWRKAISVLKDSMYADPSNESALFEIAFCYDKVGSMKDGVDFFVEYLDENPYSKAAWYNLGNSYNRLGRIKEAVDAYDFSIAIDANYLRAYHQKAEALTSSEHFADALEAYHEILSLEPTSSYILCNMGECFERLSEFEKAEDYYKQSLDLDPEFADAFVGLGVLSDLQSLPSVAVQYFEHAVNLESENTDYRLLLATSLIKVGKPKEAEKQFTIVLERDPKCEDAWEGRIDNLQQIDAHEAALEALEQGLSIVKEPTHLLYQQVVSLFKCGNEAQALDLFEQLLIHTFDSASRILDSFPELLEDTRIAEVYTRLKP
jgi:tetratricopeptide (TPR) repeat protein